MSSLFVYWFLVNNLLVLALKNINDEILENANAYQGDWLTYGKNYGENRHSELNLINKENVKNLELAWSPKFKYKTRNRIYSTCGKWCYVPYWTMEFGV